MAALIVRMFVGGRQEPVLPVAVVAAAGRPAVGEPTRDPIAAMRMPRSRTDHTLHFMEMGRLPPAAVVSVRRGDGDGR
jgi:hypothetical protein